MSFSKFIIWYFFIIVLSRPDVVDIAEYKYPGNPDYPGIGPKALPEQWETEERTVHYMIPKTLVEFLQPKLGQTGLYTLGVGGAIALLSKVSLFSSYSWK